MSKKWLCDRRLSCFLFHDWQLEVKTPKPELKRRQTDADTHLEQRTLNQMCGYENLLCDISPTLSAELLLWLWFISLGTDVVLHQVILDHQLIFPDLLPAGVHFLSAKICLFFPIQYQIAPLNIEKGNAQNFFSSYFILSSHYQFKCHQWKNLWGPHILKSSNQKICCLI